MVRIENLNINFPNEIIFKDFSLKINKGQSLAITGKSGSGKSTLLNLLAGFIPDFRGHVFINGIALNYKNIDEIRKMTAWLPQETFLNFDSVKELFLHGQCHFCCIESKSK